MAKRKKKKKKKNVAELIPGVYKVNHRKEVKLVIQKKKKKEKTLLFQKVLMSVRGY